jgi:serine/threonine protein kinase
MDLLNSRYQVINSLGKHSLLAWDLNESPPVQCVVQTAIAIPLHPQLPALLDAFDDSCVWEYIAGESLEARLARGRSSIAQIVQLLRQTLPVLQHLHDQGIVHGDVKPKNLIYRGDDLMLVDFSASHSITTPRPMGDPEYGAPEQIQGNAVYSSDLYSLGVTCLHLLTDLRPFDLFDPVEHRWAWRSYWRLDLDANFTQRDQLADYLEQLAHYNPAQRFASAAIALEHLPLVKSNAASPPPRTPTPGAPTPIPSIALIGHRGLRAGINTVDLSPDGQLIASGSDDQTVRLWQISSQTTIAQFHAPRSVKAVSFSPDGQQLAIAAHHAIYLWNLATQQTTLLTGHRHTVTALQFSPNGQWLASGSADRTVKLWSMQTLQATLTGHRLGITAVAFSPTAPILASASLDSTVRLWDLKTGSAIAALEQHTRAVRSLCFGDANTLITGGDDNLIHRWDLEQQAVTETISGHAWSVTGLAVLPDRKTLVSSSWDKTIKVWGTGTALLGHTDAVSAIAEGDEWIVSGSQDASLRLWPVQTICNLSNSPSA